MAAWTTPLARGCSAIPPLLCFLAIWRFGQNVPLYDQWTVSAPLAIATVDGSLSFRDLYAQHNEHRIFFTNLVTLLLARTTSWNLVAEMFLNLLLAIVNLAWARALLRLHGIAVTPPTLLVLSCLFLPVAYRWTWGFLSQWHFMFFFFLAGLWIAKRYPVGWGALAGVVGCSAAMTGSFGGGLLAWIVMPGVLRGLGYRARHLAAFGAAAAVCIAVYFTGYDFYFSERSASLLETAAFGLAYLGNPFVGLGGSPVLAGGVAVAGLGLLALYVSRLARAAAPAAYAVWLGVVAFALGLAAVGAWGRIELGISAALHARYVVAASLFWVGLAALGLLAAREGAPPQGSGRIARWNGVAVAILAVLYVYANGKALDRPLPPTAAQAACVKAFPETREARCLRGLLPWLRPDLANPEHRWLFDTIDALSRRRLAVFAEGAPVPR